MCHSQTHLAFTLSIQKNNGKNGRHDDEDDEEEENSDGSEEGRPGFGLSLDGVSRHLGSPVLMPSMPVVAVASLICCWLNWQT
jgi:hypothetical protein